MKLLIFLVVLKVVEGAIQIDVNLDENKNIIINYGGYDKEIITQKYIDAFGLSDETVKNALEVECDQYPEKVYLKNPTSRSDRYEKSKVDEVSTLVRVKSTKIKSDQHKTIHFLTKNFENSSTHKIKVIAALAQTVENSISSSWANMTESETTTSQDGGFSLDISVLGIPLSISIRDKKEIRNNSTRVFAGEVSENIALGSSSGVEIELEPGKAVTAVLTASKRAFEVEIEYEVTLTGAVIADFELNSSTGLLSSVLPVSEVQYLAGLATSVTHCQTLTAGVYFDESLKVYDSKTGVLIL